MVEHILAIREISASCQLILAPMKRVFIERIPGLPVTPLLYPNFGEEMSARQLFQRAFRDFKEPLVEVVSDPVQADVFLLPHNYPLVSKDTAYLRRLADLAQRHGKRIVVFWHGDGTEPVRLPNAVVFRTSQYRSSLRPDEHIMPAYAEDLSQAAVEPRPKHDGPAIVGFCGWSQYKNPKNAVGSFLQALPWEARALLTGNARWRARIKGIWLRRNVLRVLQESALIRPNLILRSSHSAHAVTIRMDPEVARREYVENMLSSDLMLCLKGNGNYSLRFYEALSLGRVPLLLDTDCAFPLEDRIDYSSFIVRVPLERLSQIDRVAAEFWDGLSPEQFSEMQRKAREAFEKYLSASSFLRYAVEHLLRFPIPSPQSPIPNP